MPDTTTYGTNGNDTLSGGNGKDTIYGLGGDDIISGGNGVDTLFGGDGDDQLTGDNGADHMTGGADDDVLDGSNGFDTAYYSGPIGEYSFYSAAGYLHIVHLGGAGADGHDQVIRVERLVFADRVINIGSGNNAPVAGDDHVFINEDTGTHSSGAASVKDNDFDFDGDALTVTAGTFTGTYGTLTLNANGTYSYTLFASAQALDDGENVTDSFNYTVSDNDGSDTGTLVFHIAGLNDAPVANDDSASITEDAAVSGNVLANDTDVDVEPLVVANPGTYVGAYGTLVLAANGSYTYTPNAAGQALDDGEVVSDTFGYTASDGTASDTATLTVTVTGLNDAPVANDDTASTTEDAAVSGNVLANDTDVDVEPLTVTNPGTYVGTYGTLVLAANGSYTYTPNAAAQGLDDGEVVSDAFGYTASDGTASDTATLTVNVAGLNDAPVANDDATSTTEDAAASGNVLANDTDVDDEPLIVANPGTYVGAYGTLVLAANGSYTYTPDVAAQALDDGDVVSDAFGYTASDGTASDTATLTVTVTGLNDAPAANDDSASTTEDAAVSGNVLTNDTDVDVEPLTVTNPGTYVGTYGTLVLAADGSYTYTPNAAAQALDDGEVVSDAFGYTASDGTASDTATLTVNVAGLNDAPFANDDTASTTEDAAVSGNVLANDTDVDVEPLVVANPGTYVGAYGTLVLAADGSYTYTPNATAQTLDDGEVVSDTFGYTASDGTASDTATLIVTVTGLNDAPVANDDAASTNEDAAVSGNVLTNDTDVDVEPLTVTNPGSYVGTYGSLVLAADGSYTYTPNAGAQTLDDGEVVSDAFGYTASDGTTSDTATLTVNVAGLNDAPVANDDTASTTEDAATSGNVLANDTDVDVEPLVVANPGTYVGAYGTLVLAANGSYIYTPNAAAQALDDGEVVNDAFGYTASDGTASDTATLTVTVTGLNDAPVANDDSASTPEDAAVSGNVLTNDTDVDVEPLTVTNPGTYVGTYGTLVLAANGSFSYTPNATANGLAAGEMAQDVFGYTASDGTASDTATLTVTVNGTNDAPTIDAGGTDDSGSVTELPNGDPNENTFTHTDSGTIAFDDVDVTDTHSASFAAQGVGYVGTFTLDPVNQAGDTVGWDFSVEDSDIDFLADGQTLTQVYEVEIDDGNGGTVTQDVTITITGEADSVPPDGTNWYIDNSAVGSANTGSSSDPFTSIAAFNAAQGTPGGPGVGDNIFLLAGLGTYTEADGINLLNGQTLTGVAAGPLRPTIVTTGGGSDGIEVAQNNTISGLDIGSTNDVGIADSGGSVGTLTISDVGKSGTGQIVDIDQGGTLNVTLNVATSTASNDGAIDLNNLAGSFTVSGATTITGIHSDGGIDITNSSLTATFAGGGTVSTNNATAVNFVGNTGSLTLAGGVDIVTTTGLGLNATGGGTVTAQGGGNSISSFISALNVANTTIGAPGLTFESISAGAAISTSGVGINLVNTGALGGLTVTGTGTAGSGGLIQNKTGADGSTTSGIGIYLENTSEVSLSEMTLQNFENHAILGVSVNGIRVTDTTIGGTIGTSTGSNDAAVAFGTTGGLNGFADGSASLFDNVDISGAVEHNFEVYQTSGTFHLTVTGSEIHDTNTATGADGLQIETVGTAHGIVRVDTTSFDDIRGDAVQATALGTSFLELTLHDNDVLTTTQGTQGFVLQNGASGDLTVAVTDNTFTGVNGTNILVGSVAGNATSAAELNAIVSGNVMTLDGPATNRTLSAFFSSTVGQVSTAKVTIDSNVINTILTSALDPLFVTTPDAGTDPLVYVAVTNNVVNIDDNGGVAGRGITVQSTQNVSTMHADVSGNDVNYLDGAPPGVVGIRVRQANPATLDLEPGVGGATAAAVLANNNPLSTTQIVGTVTVSANNSVVLPPSTPATPNLPSFLLVGFDADLLPASGGSGSEAILTQAVLDGLVDTAIDLLSDAGATAEQIAAMDAVSFTIDDLFGRRLGSSEPGAIVLDSDAAGYGWFVDGSSGELEGRIDALSVVLHELGHQIGLEDDYHGSGADLMHGYLNPGESRLPDGVFSTEPEPAPVDGMGWSDLALLVPDTMIL